MLENNIQYLKGIGPKKAEILKTEAGIETVEDLLYYAPRRYLDRSAFKSIVDTFVNETVTIAGYIKSVNKAGRKRRYLEVVIDDGTDTLTGIFFGGVSYFQSAFQIGDYILFSGKVDYYNGKQIIHPDFDFIEEDSRIKSINTGRIIPLYRSTELLKRVGLDSRGFRRIIRTALDTAIFYIDDPLERSLLEKNLLIPLKDAIFSIHFPESIEAAEIARRRLAFNELFFLHYYLSISRKFTRENVKLSNRTIDISLFEELTDKLPFELTHHQKRSLEEIRCDLMNSYPMSRLLHGDVGSGKTVVAMGAALFVISRGEQTALMAPTEVLARQHFDTFQKYLPSCIRTALLTGSTPENEKRKTYENISNGEIDIVIGTHTLIQSMVVFRKLGLIIIDEQHRFGVNQRAKLREKGKQTDLLVMTATPIPRSLTLTLYGDLDISYIKEKPSSMKPVKTLSFPESEIKGVYRSVEKYISQGRQVYFVLPLIQESEKIDLKSATETHQKLQNEIFPHRKIELLHGKMPPAKKDLIMQDFKNGDIDILVSTTVIEVGIDVPNANVIVIEHAERFGLSGLHQLRGRVGRGEHQSFCALIYPDNISEESKKRIDIIVSTGDGFKIAEEDLKIRGAGEIIGERQHGQARNFEFADIMTDYELILNAKNEAERMVSCIDNVHITFENIRNNDNLRALLKGIRTKRVLSILA